MHQVQYVVFYALSFAVSIVAQASWRYQYLPFFVYILHLWYASSLGSFDRRIQRGLVYCPNRIPMGWLWYIDVHDERRIQHRWQLPRPVGCILSPRCHAFRRITLSVYRGPRLPTWYICPVLASNQGPHSVSDNVRVLRSPSPWRLVSPLGRIFNVVSHSGPQLACP